MAAQRDQKKAAAAQGIDDKSTRARAFRGLALVFVLSLLNLAGLGLTAFSLGLLDAWTTWQFAGLFGFIELGAGVASLFMPNIWHMPVAEERIRPEVKLAASTLFLPHWGASARALGGAVVLVAVGYHEGVSAATTLIVPTMLLVAVTLVALSLVVARWGVGQPEFDVLQITIDWNQKARKLPPISISASVLQLVLGLVTLPAAGLLAPDTLFGSELRPSEALILGSVAGCFISVALAGTVWFGRISLRAPREQQVEIEAKA